MNLRLSDDQHQALKGCAEDEGVSMHAIVLRAVDEYVARAAHQARVRRSTAEQAAKWGELMERLT